MYKNRINKKPYVWAIIFSLVLASLSSFILLDTFVFEYAVSSAADIESGTDNDGINITAESDTTSGVIRSSSSSDLSTAVVSSNTYEDENISITIETQYIYDTMVYIADIEVSDFSYLKTAFANDTYGRNIKQTTSAIAEQSSAIFAVNGDYYGFRNDGYVIRNGILYRDVSGEREDLVIDYNGDFSIINESDISAQSLVDSGAWQVLSFGPALIENGVLAVDTSSEVDRSKTSNPRTAIGQVSALHYVFVVADGRTSQSAGLTLEELAQIMSEQGCITAYNLDGGGSSTMWFNGEIINIPTDGRSLGERSVSDIVYFG